VSSHSRKIGEIAELLGTTPRTLRYYEEEGLIAARRSAGGTRYYCDEDIARFRAVLRLAETGLTLDDIRRLAGEREKHPTGAQSSREVRRIIGDLLNSVRSRQESLARMEAELSAAAHAIEHCRACGNPPTRQGCPECPINALLGESDILNLVWEQAHPSP